MPIHLDIRQVLPLARAAFDAGQLEIQNDAATRCTYAGPCAIGVALTPEQRIQCDDGSNNATGIIHLLQHKIIIAPEDQHAAFVELQDAHDSGDLAAFELTLQGLEGEWKL